VAEKNIERGNEMIDSIKDKIKQNRAFIDLLKYLSYTYNSKPLNINAMNLDYYLKNYP
jgi:adenine C2-methylase RlmN of 23S rRNA A2503 and tRNA A37